MKAFTVCLSIRCLRPAMRRIFAKPFLSAFPHDDGVTCLARNPRILNSLVSLYCMFHAHASRCDACMQCLGPAACMHAC